MRLVVLTAAFLTLVAIALATYYFGSPHATLRIATGPAGGAASRFVGAFTATLTTQHPRIRVATVEVATLAESARSIEDGAADLAIIRSDAAIPANGATIAILRRDVVAVVVAAKSAIDKVPALAGKTIGIPQSNVQSDNAAALDALLGYYDVPAKSVQRIFLPIDEIGRALAEKRIAAALAVGPIGPGEVVTVVNAVKAATKGAPKIVAIDEAGAINKRFPGFESIDVPDGAFRGQPPVPDDTVTTAAVTYRLVAPNSMLDIVAGAIAKSLFTAKTKLMQLTPVAAQIEAPDPDDKNPALPVHPGVAAYLNNGVQSFFDEFQGYLYIGGMALSAVGSLVALALGRLGRRASQAQVARIDELIGLADQALRARTMAEIASLEQNLNAIVGWFVKSGAAADTGAFSVAISHARYAIDRQRALIAPQAPQEHPRPEGGPDAVPVGATAHPVAIAARA